MRPYKCDDIKHIGKAYKCGGEIIMHGRGELLSKLTTVYQVSLHFLIVLHDKGPYIQKRKG